MAMSGQRYLKGQSNYNKLNGLDRHIFMLSSPFFLLDYPKLFRIIKQLEHDIMVI